MSLNLSPIGPFKNNCYVFMDFFLHLFRQIKSSPIIHCQRKLEIMLWALPCSHTSQETLEKTIWAVCSDIWQRSSSNDCNRKHVMGIGRPKQNSFAKTQKEGTPSRETWTGLKSGPMRVSWGAIRPSVRCCTWVEAVLDMSINWETNSLRAALLRMTWRS